jgi:hypothetical protein
MTGSMGVADGEWTGACGGHRDWQLARNEESYTVCFSRAHRSAWYLLFAAATKCALP